MRSCAAVVKPSATSGAVKIRRQVFALLSSHVPPSALSARTRFFGWMHFTARVTEKYTSISADCCCLLGSYHSIVSVTLVELMDPIEVCVCVSAPYMNTMLLCCLYVAELHMLINA